GPPLAEAAVAHVPGADEEVEVGDLAGGRAGAHAPGVPLDWYERQGQSSTVEPDQLAGGHCPGSSAGARGGSARFAGAHCTRAIPTATAARPTPSSAVTRSPRRSAPRPSPKIGVRK